MSIRAYTVLLAATTALGTLAAQQRQVPGTFRSSATLVPVDVRVLDRDGRAVTDLSRGDFTVVEDGVAQTVVQFAQQTLAPGEPDPAAASIARDPAPKALAVPRHRTFLIVFGRGRLHHPSKGVDATIRFVRDRLLPQDQVAVLAYNRATDFTSNHGEVVRLLDNFGRRHEAIESRLAFRFLGLSGLYGGRRLPDALRTEIDELFKVADGPAFRTVPPGRVTESGRIAQDFRRGADRVLAGDVANSSERALADPTDPSSVLDMSLDDYISTTARTMTDLENLYTGIEYLRYLEGEKHLIFVTERGLFLPRVEDDQGIAAMANDARVVLHTIQTGGVSAGQPIAARGGAAVMGADWPEAFSIQALRMMSELTGGHASAYAYADKALERIDRSSRSQYLLGYSPTNANWDARYRRIEVRVNRADVTVHYRQGYYARPQLVPYDRRAFLTYSRISAAALYPDPIRDIKVKAKTSYVRGEQRGGEIAIELTIDVSSIRLEITPERHEAMLDYAIAARDANGTSVGDKWDQLPVRVPPGDYTRALRDGVTFSIRVPVRSSPRSLKIVVYDYAGDAIGTLETKVY